MKARRILIFSLSYFPRLVGGAEVAVKEITDRIPSSDIQFEMITLGDGVSPKEETIGNVKVMRIMGSNGWPQKLAYPFVAGLKARKLVSRYKYDAMWAIMASYAGYAAYIVKRASPGLPLVLTIQEGEHFERRKKILWRAHFARIFSSADRITTISSYLATWARGMGAKCPIDVVPNAVDISLFSQEPGEAELSDLKKKTLKKPDERFLITTSRLVEKNAVSDIIESLLHLPKDVKLLILGAGPLETELKHQCLRLGLNYMDEPPMNDCNRVHFLGYVPHSDMPKYLAVSDVFVRPSITEGLGNSFLEAMAAGVPVVATSVGGIPDFLKDWETGLFCQVRNPKSIAEKVQSYLNDKTLRANIVKRARALVSERYNWQKVATDMKHVLMSAR